VLEQENAALHAMDIQLREELERSIADHLSNLRRASALERENAVLQSQLEAECLENSTLRRDHASEAERAWSLQQQLLAERNRRQALDQEIEALRNRHAAQTEVSKQLEETIHALLHSSSWRVTGPMRWLRRTLVGSLRPTAVAPTRMEASPSKPDPTSVDADTRRKRGRSTARQCLLVLARLAFKYPVIGHVFWKALSVFPQIKSRLVLFINNNRQSLGTPIAPTDQTSQPTAVAPMPLSLTQTSATIASVHQRLSTAISRQQVAEIGSNKGQTGKSTS